MILSHRQTLLYEHTCDLWQPARTITSGVPSTPTFSLQASDVKCYFQINPSVSQPNVYGRSETDIIFTLDVIHFPEDTEIDEEWVIVNTTLLPDGTQSGNYGRFWIVRGNPRKISRSRRRPAGKLMVYASQMATAPTGVTV